MLISVASFLNFLYAHLLIFIWKETSYYYVAIIVVSFLIGTVLEDYTRAILYGSFSLIIGSIASVEIVIAPAIIYGAERAAIDANILYYGSELGKLLLLSLPLCFFMVIIGCSLGEALERRSMWVKDKEARACST